MRGSSFYNFLRERGGGGRRRRKEARSCCCVYVHACVTCFVAGVWASGRFRPTLCGEGVVASGSLLFCAACLTACTKKEWGEGHLSVCVSSVFFFFFFTTRGINYSACCKRPDPPHSYMCPEQEPLFHCGCRLPQIVKSLAYEKVISRYIKRLFMLLSSLSVCINFSETKSGNVCDCSDVGCRASHRPKLEFEVTVKCKSIRSTQLHLVLILLQCSLKAGSSR